MTHVRGLVVSTPVKINDGGSITIRGGGLDPQELRFSLLLWDKLDHPAGLLSINGGPDAEFLEKAGILTRTSLAVHIGDLIGQSSEPVRLMIDGSRVGSRSTESLSYFGRT